MQVTSVTQIPRGVIIETDAGTKLRLEGWRKDIIRLSYTKGEFAPAATAIVCGTPEEVPVTVSEQGAFLTVSTGCATVEIKKTTFAVRFLRDGKELCRLSRWGMQLKDTTVTTPHYVSDRDTEDMLKLVSTDEHPGYKFYLSFDFEKEEKIFGLGQYGLGVLNRREAPIYLHQTNNYSPNPFFVSSKGYGILVDTGAYAAFSRDAFGTTFYTDSVDMGDYYLVASQNPDGAISGFRFLTGHVPMMPKWLFGYAQSKERYVNQQELLDVVKEYRRRNVPLDLIVQDWNYWYENMWSEKAFDPARYPDPDGLCRDVHANNAHIMISVWPNTRGGSNFRELFEKDQLMTDSSTFGGGGCYNVFDEGSCQTYFDQTNRGILAHGFDALWCDSSEPFEPNYGSFMQADEQKDIALDVYKKWMDSRKINLYSLMHCRSVYNRQREQSGEKRVVTLTRSGYAGQQRYSGIVWSGDIESSFYEMKKQIAEGLNFCISGLPYWTLDVGGFHGRKGDATFNTACDYSSNTDPGYRELYCRWIQFGCFLPVFRSHGTGFAREIWRFGEEGEMFYDSIRKFIELRYRLMPYIYSTAWQVSKNDETFLRMLAFDFANDPEALTQDETYMFGRAFLVSPVTAPQYFEGADLPLDASKTKDVYLPAGADWYDFWSEQRIVGGQTVTVDTPIDSVPLFVRAGSVVPTGPIMQHTAEMPDAPYDITVYPGADASFTLYEDSGDSYDYEKGAYAEYDLHWNEDSRVLTVSARRGSFNGMCSQRALNVRVVGGESKQVVYTGSEIKLQF